MKFSILTPLAALALLIPAFGQSPEEIAEAYFTAFDEEDYDAVAGMMSTNSLTEFRSFFDELMNLDADQAEMMMQSYLGDEVTPENIILLSDEEFFSKYMENAMGQMKQFMEMSFEEQTVLGKVPEGELIHVLSRYKMKMDGNDLEQVEVITLEKQGDAWKVQLSGDIKAMAQSIKKSLEMMNVQ